MYTYSCVDVDQYTAQHNNTLYMAIPCTMRPIIWPNESMPFAMYVRTLYTRLFFSLSTFSPFPTRLSWCVQNVQFKCHHRRASRILALSYKHKLTSIYVNIHTHTYTTRSTCKVTPTHTQGLIELNTCMKFISICIYVVSFIVSLFVASFVHSFRSCCCRRLFSPSRFHSIRRWYQHTYAS